MLKSQRAKSWKLILTERVGEDFVRGTEWGTKSGGGVIVSIYMQDGITWCRKKYLEIWSKTILDMSVKLSKDEYGSD